MPKHGVTDTSVQPRGVIFLSCFLALSDSLYSNIETLGAAVRAKGAILVFGTPDDPHKWHDKPCSFEIHQIPSRMIDGRGHQDVDSPTQPYEQWLLDVERGWYGFDTSAGGVHSVRRSQSDARTYLSSLRPDVAVFWSSGVYPISRVWHDVARELGIPSFCLEKGLVPGTWLLDSIGLNAQSEYRFRPLDAAREETLASLRTLITQLAPVNESSVHARRIVLVLGGADWAGLLPRTIPGAAINSPVFASSDDLAASVADLAAEFPDVDFVYRPHPFALRGADLDSLPLKVDVKTPAPEMILRADAIVCGLTSLQYEALLRRKPVVLAGVSPLWGRGVAYEVKDRGELRAQIALALARQGHDERMVRAEMFLGAILEKSYRVRDEVPARPLWQLAAELTASLGPSSTVTAEDRARAKSLLGTVGAPTGRDVWELFWDAGAGFSAAQSLTSVWFADGEEQTIELRLPAPVSGRFRIDPACAPVAIDLRQIELKIRDSWVDVGSLKERALVGGDAVWLGLDSHSLYLSYGADPILELAGRFEEVSHIRLRGIKFSGSVAPYLAEAVKGSLLPANKVIDVALQEMARSDSERVAASSSPGEQTPLSVASQSLDWHGHTWRKAWLSLEAQLNAMRDQLIEQKHEIDRLRLAGIDARKERDLAAVENRELITKLTALASTIHEQNAEVQRVKTMYERGIELAESRLKFQDEELKRAMNWLNDLRNRLLVKWSLRIHKERWPFP